MPGKRKGKGKDKLQAQIWLDYGSVVPGSAGKIYHCKICIEKGDETEYETANSTSKLICHVYRVHREKMTEVAFGALVLKVEETTKKLAELEEGSVNKEAFEAFQENTPSRVSMANVNAATKRQIDEYATKVEDLEEKVTGVEEKITGIDEKFAGVDEKFAGVDEKFAGVDEKFAGVDEKFAGVDEKFAGVDEKFAGVDEKFVEFEKGFEGFTGRLEKLEEKVVAGESVLEELAEVKKVMIELHVKLDQGEKERVRQQQEIVGMFAFVCFILAAVIFHSFFCK